MERLLLCLGAAEAWEAAAGPAVGLGWALGVLQAGEAAAVLGCGWARGRAGTATQSCCATGRQAFGRFQQ